jgi:hypothetical protein
LRSREQSFKQYRDGIAQQLKQHSIKTSKDCQRVRFQREFQANCHVDQRQNQKIFDRPNTKAKKNDRPAGNQLLYLNMCLFWSEKLDSESEGDVPQGEYLRHRHEQKGEDQNVSRQVQIQLFSY